MHKNRLTGCIWALSKTGYNTVIVNDNYESWHTSTVCSISGSLTRSAMMECWNPVATPAVVRMTLPQSQATQN